MPKPTFPLRRQWDRYASIPCAQFARVSRNGRHSFGNLRLILSMVVGVLKLSLALPENHSLKGKRGVLKRIQARVVHQFNISVTECGDQDLWQSSVLGFGMVGSSRPIIEATLHKVVDYVDNLGLAEVENSEVEFFYC